MYQNCCHVKIVMWLLPMLIFDHIRITKHVCIVIWAEPERLIYKVFCFLAATAHVSSFDFSRGIFNHNHHKSAGMNSRRFDLMKLYFMFVFSYLLNSFTLIAAMLKTANFGRKFLCYITLGRRVATFSCFYLVIVKPSHSDFWCIWHAHITWI